MAYQPGQAKVWKQVEKVDKVWKQVLGETQKLAVANIEILSNLEWERQQTVALGRIRTKTGGLLGGGCQS